MRLVSAAIGGLLAVMSTQSPQPAESGATRGVVAVLRRDGIVLPFAAFNGYSWSVPWPETFQYRELPINVDAVPENWWGGERPRLWRAWLTDGTERPLTLHSTTMFRAACVTTRLGLKSDHRPLAPPPPVPTIPYPKDGLALGGSARVEPIEMVNQSSADWGSLAVALLEQFNRAEDRQVSAAANQSGWRHTYNREKRHTIPVRIESWYRSPNGEGGTVSWIEAVRRYPPGPDDDGCGLETFFSGWVYHDKARAEPRGELQARLMYCDRAGASYMLPFGRLRIRDRGYWVYQLSGYESEWYAVVELGQPRIKFVAEYFAGSCRGPG